MVFTICTMPLKQMFNLMCSASDLQNDSEKHTHDCESYGDVKDGSKSAAKMPMLQMTHTGRIEVEFCTDVDGATWEYDWKSDSLLIWASSPIWIAASCVRVLNT